MIEVEDLHKRYKHVKAVDGLSFTAQPGEVTGFLGPNGAGKTTTIDSSAIALLALYAVVLAAITVGVEDRRDVHA